MQCRPLRALPILYTSLTSGILTVTNLAVDVNSNRYSSLSNSLTLAIGEAESYPLISSIKVSLSMFIVYSL